MSNIFLNLLKFLVPSADSIYGRKAIIMISSISSSICALNAFGTKMDITDNNIANVASEGFKKSRAILSEGDNGAVEAEVTRIDTPGNIIYEEDRDGQMVEKELSNVDLSEEIPQTIIAQRGSEANLKSIATRDEMLGSILEYWDNMQRLKSGIMNLA